MAEMTVACSERRLPMITAPIRLVALDLDGTLVGQDLAIRPRVRAAIARARERGIVVTIVTGRMFAATKPFAEQLGLDGCVVCYQGAAVFEIASGAVLRQTPVRQDVTREVVRLGRRARRTRPRLRRRPLYVQQINRFSKRYTDLAKVEPHRRAVARRAFPRPPVAQDRLRRYRRARGGGARRDRCRCSATARTSRAATPDFVEILDPGVNKGKALAFVAERFDATLDETLAIGDAWNDLPLLEAAGIGVAMGSGPPELLARADAVVARRRERRRRGSDRAVRPARERCSAAAAHAAVGVRAHSHVLDRRGAGARARLPARSPRSPTRRSSRVRSIDVSAAGRGAGHARRRPRGGGDRIGTPTSCCSTPARSARAIEAIPYVQTAQRAARAAAATGGADRGDRARAVRVRHRRTARSSTIDASARVLQTGCVPGRLAVGLGALALPAPGARLDDAGRRQAARRRGDHRRRSFRCGRSGATVSAGSRPSTSAG